MPVHKRRFPRTPILIISAVSVLLTISVPANSATKVTTVSQMLSALSVKSEVTGTYSAAKFKFWTDADKDSCNTREEVLLAESLVKAKTGSGCKILSGTWKSSYDGIITTDSSTFDIDHFVPRKEAWESGAYGWDVATRTAFANDLDFAGSLVAVSASSNRSKGDRDPQNWMPKDEKYYCTYVANWIAVKYRWSLSIDNSEKTFLSSKVKKCGKAAKSQIPTKVKIVLGPKANSNPVTPQTSGGEGLDSRYSTCADAKAAGKGPYYKGVDPEYAWYRDGDKDGIACE